MPNQVTYHDDKTMTKVIKTLVAGDELTLDQALDAVMRLQNAGILFREPAPEKAKVETTEKPETLTGE